MKPSLMLLNPSAGKGRAGEVEGRLRQEVARRGLPLEILVTRSEKHLRETVRTEGAGRPLLVAAGGDSTMTIMAEELLPLLHPPRIGFVGLGSSNDLALAFGIDGLQRSLDALAGGRSLPIDVGEVVVGGERRGVFLGQVNAGIGVEVNLAVERWAAKRSILRRLQTLPGFLEIWRAFSCQTVPLPLFVESRNRKSEGEYAVALFSNTRFWASGRRVNPDADPCDGLLDLCLIEADSPLSFLKVAARTGSGKHLGRKGVIAYRSESFTLSSGRGFSLQCDGEVLREGGRPLLLKEAEIRLLPGALEMIVPSDYS